MRRPGALNHPVSLFEGVRLTRLFLLVTLSRRHQPKHQLLSGLRDWTLLCPAPLHRRLQEAVGVSAEFVLGETLSFIKSGMSA